MPVVINEFEVTPAPPPNENTTPDRKAGDGSGKKPELTDYEVKQMLERRTERAERVAEH